MQLDLFGRSEVLPGLERAQELAARLPPHVRFGTSSWSFPGWAGLVYRGQPSERELAERGLQEYASYPLFGCVGIDRSYYAPLEIDTLRRYRSQLPAGFPCVIKAFNEITNAVHPRTRDPNPDFLNLERLKQEVLEPLSQEFAEHVGALVFEIMPLRRSELPEPSAFNRRLSRFLSGLPRGLPYAVELRNRELFTHAYLDVLAEHGVGHVLNFWERMPGLGVQLDVPGVLTAPFVVCRLLIPPGERYDDRKRNLAPFDRIVSVQDEMRDDVVRLAEACRVLGKVLLVIVNNKAEGSSPLTIFALAERLAEASG